MKSRRFLAAAACCMGLMGVVPESADAQLLDRVRRARQEIENEVANALEERLRNAIRCTLGDEACVERAREQGQETVFVGEDGEVVTNADGEPIFDHDEAQQTAGYAPQVADGSSIANPEVWRNYDFVPGSKVIYALDLGTERLGRFPARQLEFVGGAAAVVERGGERMIEFTDATTMNIRLPEPLPDDFTVQFDYQAALPNAGLYLASGNMPSNMLSYDYHYLRLGRSAGAYLKSGAVSTTDTLGVVADRMVSFALQVDGDPEVPGDDSDYTILYAETDRIAMVPNATWERGSTIQLHVPANGSNPAYLSNIVVAIHGDPLYESLTSGDRTFTTRGILFDVDSDRLRGESIPTLQEILRTLEEHPSLSVDVEGHTDGQGDDDYNFDLSLRRAQSVVNWLAAEGVGVERLNAVGKGEGEPVGDNATEIGRQQNRRVVLRNVTMEGAAGPGPKDHPFER